MSYREYTEKEAIERIQSKFYSSFIRISVDNRRTNYAFFDFVDFTIHNNKVAWTELLEWFSDNIKIFHELRIELRVYKGDEHRTPVNVCCALSYEQFKGMEAYNIHVLNCALSSMLDEMMHYLLQ